MNKYKGFRVGDRVIGDWFQGEIESFEMNHETGEVYAIVLFETGCGGGRLPFSIEELSHAQKEH